MALNFTRSILLAIFFWCVVCQTAIADENSDANRLVVEAVQLLNAADGERDAGKRLELLTSAKQNLDRIIERYPGSDAAVKLATGQAIGNLSIHGVSSRIADVKYIDCFAAYRCLVTQALEIANSISNADYRELALYFIAEAQAQAGEIAGNLEAAYYNSLYPSGYAQDLSYTAIARVEAGDIVGAKKMIINSIYNADRAWAMSNIAEAQAQAGDIADALETANSISLYPSRRVQALSYIAIAQVKAGDLVGADETLGSAIEAGRGRPWWVMSDIAIAQLKLGDIEGAKQTVYSISDDIDRAKAMSSIATAQAQAGDIAGANETLGTAIETANSFSDHDVRAVILVALHSVALAKLHP